MDSGGEREEEEEGKDENGNHLIQAPSDCFFPP